MPENEIIITDVINLFLYIPSVPIQTFSVDDDKNFLIYTAETTATDGDTFACRECEISIASNKL